MNLNVLIDFEPLYGLVILLGILFFKRRKLRSNSKFDNFVLITFYIYIICLIATVFFPIPLFLLTQGPEMDFPLTRFFNLVPFIDMAEVLKRGLYIQVLGNILLLFPLGFYLFLQNNKTSLKKIILIALATTFMIESIQLSISLFLGVPERIFDIDDFILNLLGAVIGYYFSKVCLPWINKLKVSLNQKSLNAPNAQS